MCHLWDDVLYHPPQPLNMLTQCLNTSCFNIPVTWVWYVIWYVLYLKLVQNKFNYEDVFYALRQVQLVFAPPSDEIQANPCCQSSHFSQANLQFHIKSVPKFNLTNASTPCNVDYAGCHAQHSPWVGHYRHQQSNLYIICP